MDRKAQIEALAKAWEALGDMHMANETWLGEDGDHDDPRRVIRYGRTRTEAVLAAAVAAKEGSSARTQEDK